MQIDQHRDLFICDCGDVGHQFILQYFEDPSFDDEEPELYLSIHLNQSCSFWEKVKNAFRYLFSRDRSRFGDFDEVILNARDARILRDRIDKWLNTKVEAFVKKQEKDTRR